MSTIKLVLFDIGNVILRSTHQITFAVLWELGVRPDFAPLFFHSQPYRDFARGKITGMEFTERVGRLLEASWLTQNQIRTAHDAHIYMLDVDVMQIMDELFRERFPVGFVTTTNEWQTARERTFVELQAIGPVARSHEMGVTKTDPGAWPLILERFAVLAPTNPSSILFVDDAPANIVAASDAGLATHHFNANLQDGARELREALKAHDVLQ